MIVSRRGTHVQLLSRTPRKSSVLSIYRTLDITYASTIASFIGARTRRKPHVWCAASVDTRKVRKHLEKWYGTFLSLLVCSAISWTLRKRSSCDGMRKGRSQEMTMMPRKG